jgi:tetratricopeptide (TPR) repeat protein
MRISAFRQALQHYQRVLELLPEAAETERMTVLLRLAEAYHYLDEFETAQKHLNEVIALADKHRDLDAQANALFRLCQISVAQGDYQTAYNYSSKALPLARSANNPRTLARVLFAVGDPRPRKLSTTEVVESLEESLRLARESGDVVQELHTLNRLGAVLQTEQQFERSQRYLEECRDLALKVGNRERAIAALINIGAASWYQENFESAYHFYQQALNVARDTGNRIMLVDSLGNLGLAAVVLGKLDEAEAALTEGLRIARLINSRYGVLTNIMGHAALKIRKGDIDQGLAWMGLVWHHPSGTESLHQDMELMRRHLAPDLSDDAFQTGMEVGRGLSLDEVIGAVT